MDKDSKIFNDKSFSSIIEDVYSSFDNKSKKIKELIDVLQPMVSDIKDATMIVPLIKEYLEIDVKNDENLIKLSSIIQRYMNAENKNKDDNPFTLSDDELQELIESTEQDAKLESKEKEEMEKLDEKANNILEEYRNSDEEKDGDDD